MPQLVEMNDEDFAAYSLYLCLPPSLKWTVRAFVSLCRSDQNLVRRLVRSLQRTAPVERWHPGGPISSSPPSRVDRRLPAA